MIADKAAYKVVAMIVARLQSKCQIYVLGAGDFFESGGVELGLQKVVFIALVDEDRALKTMLFQEQGRVPFFPALAVFAKVMAKRFFSPWNVGGMANRCEG